MSNDFDAPGTLLDTMPTAASGPAILQLLSPERPLKQARRNKYQAPVGRVCFIRERAVLHRVEMNSIRTVSAEGNYVELQTDERLFTLRNSMGEILAQLGDPRFMQVNRNMAVNIMRVDRVDHDMIVMQNDLVTLSRMYRTTLLRRLQVLCGR